jgi:organic hydroperoxide reductase OsmC/OhrA
MKQERKYTFENTISRNQDEPAKVMFSGPGQMEIGAAAEFGGGGQGLNPEEMFVAAINSCLMNTFLYFTQKFKIETLSYNSQASGQLEKQSDGFRFTNVEVQAKVQLPEGKFTEKTRQAGSLAKKYCLVSRSVACPVDYHLEIEINEKIKS